jgi:hypothetical protein
MSGIFLITEVAQIFGLLLFQTDQLCMYLFRQNVLGYILGDFFINSAGHPVSNTLYDQS